MTLLAIAYGKVGRRDEAIKLGEEALELLQRSPASESHKTPGQLYAAFIAMMYVDTGHYQEAVALLEKVLPQIRQRRGAKSYWTLVAMAPGRCVPWNGQE